MRAAARAAAAPYGLPAMAEALVTLYKLLIAKESARAV